MFISAPNPYIQALSAFQERPSSNASSNKVLRVLLKPQELALGFVFITIIFSLCVMIVHYL